MVAREIRRPGEEPIFAPTPPGHSCHDLGRRTERARDPESEQRIQISGIDMSRAYFSAERDPNAPNYVELPEEHPAKRKGMCALLRKHMYGTRKAADGIASAALRLYKTWASQ